METNTEDTIEENVSTAEETEDEPTEPLENLEKPAPARKPRTQKQKAAFEKAREALAVKRANDKEFKAANKKPIGRPKKVAAVKEKVEPKARRSVAQGGRKQTMVYVDDSHTDESSDSEPESIVVRRRRKKRKPKKRKPQQVIYISESAPSLAVKPAITSSYIAFASAVWPCSSNRVARFIFAAIVSTWSAPSLAV